MNKQKSKSNILLHQKKPSKPKNTTVKSQGKHLDPSDLKPKLPLDIKKSKPTHKESKSNKTITIKPKNPIQKSSHPKIYQHLDNQPLFSIQRRNSASIVSQRAPSRLSNKRSSVVSSKSNKFLKDEDHKQNDQNRNNLNQIQSNENQCIFECLEQPIKNSKSKKKLSLNFNPKSQEQVKNQKLTNKKLSKGENVQKFQKKLSTYLIEKDIFSEKFLQETKCSKNKSKKNLNAKSKQKIEENLQKSKNSSERENKETAIEIYHKFYKKSFEINLNNCMKYSSYGSKDDRSKQTFSKTTIKPSQSTTLMFAKENNLKLVDSKIDLRERKNASNCSNDSKSRSKSKQTLSKSRKNDSKSIFDKENRILSQIQASSLLQSRSKSRNSIVNNSSNSGKEHGLSYQVQRQCANSTIQESNLRRSKKSYQNLIVFRENPIKNNQQELKMKYFDKIKSQIEDINEMRKISDQQINKIHKMVQEQEKQDVIDMRKVEVGSSNIDVLKWWSNSKRQLSTSIANNEKKSEQKGQKIEQETHVLMKIHQNDKQTFVITSELQQIVKGVSTKTAGVDSLDHKQNQAVVQNNSPKISPNQDQIFIKLKNIKSKDELSSLGDLSSISSIHEYQQMTDCRKISTNQRQNDIERIPFEL